MDNNIFVSIHARRNHESCIFTYLRMPASLREIKKYANVILPYMKLEEIENIKNNFNYKSLRPVNETVERVPPPETLCE